MAFIFCTGIHGWHLVPYAEKYLYMTKLNIWKGDFAGLTHSHWGSIVFVGMLQILSPIYFVTGKIMGGCQGTTLKYMAAGIFTRTPFMSIKGTNYVSKCLESSCIAILHLQICGNCSRLPNMTPGKILTLHSVWKYFNGPPFQSSRSSKLQSSRPFIITFIFKVIH